MMLSTFLWELFASKYRKEILRQARGSILEVGVGTGNSFKDHPSGKDTIAVDISQRNVAASARATEKLKNYNRNIKLTREDVQRLTFENEAFDTILKIGLGSAVCLFVMVLGEDYSGFLYHLKFCDYYFLGSA